MIEIQISLDYNSYYEHNRIMSIYTYCCFVMFHHKGGSTHNVFFSNTEYNNTISDSIIEKYYDFIIYKPDEITTFKYY